MGFDSPQAALEKNVVDLALLGSAKVSIVCEALLALSYTCSKCNDVIIDNL